MPAPGSRRSTRRRPRASFAATPPPWPSTCGILEPKAALDSPARDSQLSDPERPIITYCGSGARSALAAATLQQLGFSQVRSLAGGFQAWTQEGRPIVR